jgi:hypothetical protein
MGTQYVFCAVGAEFLAYFPYFKNVKVGFPVKKTELTAGGSVPLTTRHPLSAKSWH